MARRRRKEEEESSKVLLFKLVFLLALLAFLPLILKVVFWGSNKAAGVMVDKTFKVPSIESLQPKDQEPIPPLDEDQNGNPENE